MLREIAAIQNRKGPGVIHGLIAESASPSVPVPGVRVEARGRKGVYTAVTDAEGKFQIKVPPGHYVVRPAKSDLSFTTDDFSYEDPQNLQIEPGGCVQIQLWAIERP